MCAATITCLSYHLPNSSAGARYTLVSPCILTVFIRPEPTCLANVMRLSAHPIVVVIISPTDYGQQVLIISSIFWLINKPVSVSPNICQKLAYNKIESNRGFHLWALIVARRALLEAPRFSVSTLSFGKLKALKIPFNVYYDVLGWRPSNISFRVGWPRWRFCYRQIFTKI